MSSIAAQTGKVSISQQEDIASDIYVRDRLNPQPGDLFYLHLSDMLLAFNKFATDEALRILDFGCGGSPYRSLFPRSTYERADFAGTPNVDHVIPSDGSACRLDVADGTYDMVISSQVLEHVTDPTSYLKEALRLLRPGGRLLLTTHGTYEDHGCPYDYRRWTDSGLRCDLEQAGFEVEQMMKMTTGGRAVVFILQRHRGAFGRSRIPGLLFWLVNGFMFRFRKFFNRQCDFAFSSNRVATDGLEHHRFYLALLASAVRPDKKSTDSI